LTQLNQIFNSKRQEISVLVDEIDQTSLMRSAVDEKSESLEFQLTELESVIESSEFKVSGLKMQIASQPMSIRELKAIKNSQEE
jgi:hypothetical protein